MVWNRFLLGLFVCVAVLTTPPSARALGLVRGPYLQQPTPTSMIVRWRTDTFAESTLRYGLDFGDFSMTISSPGLVTDHEIKIQGLEPGTGYYYSVGTPSQTLAGADADHYFVTTTLPDTSRRTRLWVLGDSGTNTLKSAQVKNAYLDFVDNEPADLLLMLGDNAYLIGTDEQYTVNLFQNYPEILRHTVLWPTPGNHDFSATEENGLPSSSPLTETGPYYDAFTLPTQGESGGVASGTETYYSFDHGNIHFISLNIYRTDTTVDSAMYAWVVADLAANQQDWLIVFLHFPPYSRGGRDSDTTFHMVKVRTLYNPLFEQAGADLVLAGHSHTYERSMLIDGHYGLSNSLTPENIIDAGDGDPLSNGAYFKPTTGNAPHEGTVYVVNGVGENAHADGGTLDHPVMVSSFEIEGSMVIDIRGNVLNAHFISLEGAHLDRFRILKGNSAVQIPSGDAETRLILVLLLLGTARMVRRRASNTQTER
jgi:hypothetical protein